MKKLTALFMVSIISFLINQYWYFQNHEPHYAINISIENDAKWVGFLEIDEDFVKNELLPELFRITNSKPLPLPTITIIAGDIKNIIGIYHTTDEIKLFEDKVLEETSDFYNRNRLRFDMKECKVRECSALLYNFLAHELLHYIYNKIYGYSDAYSDHKRMLDKQELLKISNFIRKKLNSNGIAQHLSMEALKDQVDEAEEEIQEYLRTVKND